MTPLLEFYKKILLSIGCIIDKDDFILYRIDKSKDPVPVEVRVDGTMRKMVLPTPRILKDGDWNELVAFHPGCESPVAGQSEVLNMLTALIGYRLVEAIQRAVGNIVMLALNTDLRDKLSLSQMELIGSFPAIDRATEKLVVDIAKKNTQILGKNPLLTLVFARGGEIDGEIFNRTCTLIPYVITRDKMCGVTPSSEKSRNTVSALYKYVLPEQLTYGSNNAAMPYLFALLKTYYAVAVHLNKIRVILGKHAVAMEEIPVAWYEELKELPKLVKKYLPRPLQGNVGPVTKVGEEEPEEEAVAEGSDQLLDLTQPARLPKVAEGVKSKLGLQTPVIRSTSTAPPQLVRPVAPSAPQQSARYPEVDRRAPVYQPEPQRAVTADDMMSQYLRNQSSSGYPSGGYSRGPSHGNQSSFRDGRRDSAPSLGRRGRSEFYR